MTAMGSAICRHLPLITPRIEFTPQGISELPSITPRLCFNNLYDMHSPPDAADNVVPAIDSDGDIDLSVIGDDVESEDENIEATETMIPKPAGVAGRPCSGGYNLEVALNWNEETLSKITVSQFIASQAHP